MSWRDTSESTPRHAIAVLRALTKLTKFAVEGDTAAALKVQSRWPEAVLVAIDTAYQELTVRAKASRLVPRRVVMDAFDAVGDVYVQPSNAALRVVVGEVAGANPLPDVFRLRDLNNLLSAVSLRIFLHTGSRSGATQPSRRGRAVTAQQSTLRRHLGVSRRSEPAMHVRLREGEMERLLADAGTPLPPAALRELLALVTDADRVETANLVAKGSCGPRAPETVTPRWGRPPRPLPAPAGGHPWAGTLLLDPFPRRPGASRSRAAAPLVDHPSPHLPVSCRAGCHSSSASDCSSPLSPPQRCSAPSPSPTPTPRRRARRAARAADA